MLFHPHQPISSVTVDAATQPVFVYGTLQNPMTQINVFGRYDWGTPDILPGYRVESIRLGNTMYPALRHDQEDFVTGLRIAVTEDELQRIDHYETSAYSRIRLTLRSGNQCWVYLQNTQA